MKKHSRFLPACLAAALCLTACASADAQGAKAPASAGNDEARRIDFDRDWKFQLGNPPNAQASDFDDSQWRTLDLPHDWSIENLPNPDGRDVIGPFSKKSPGAWDTGYFMGGEGWYRKNLVLTEADKGKRIRLYFEGVYNQAEVYVNGRKAAFNAYGYTSFKVDATPFCDFSGKPNTIAVKVVNHGDNSRWYTGSGIYRHVWLEKTDPVHLDEWDVFVDASRVKNGRAQVRFSAKVLNAASAEGAGALNVRIVAPNGKRVFSGTKEFELKKGEDAQVAMAFAVEDAQLWSPESPKMYKAVVSMKFGDMRDRLSVPFGIRTLEFSAKKGFLLNGKKTLLKGACLHHDNGMLGAVAIDRAEERKLQLLKKNGFNAVRCSHNPPSVNFLNLCDRMGMLVVDESFDMWRKPKNPDDYHRWFDEWSERDLETMVRRDRNHPSIIMWSIGNEIPERGTDDGIATTERLVKIVKKHDVSRPVTASIHMWNYPWNDNHERGTRHLDVAGYNYPEDADYDKDHEKHPDRIVYSSETYAKTAWRTWDYVLKRPYVIGDFVWTAFDYLGEVGLAHNLYLKPGERGRHLMEWPWYNAWCGDMDFCGDKKPQSWYRDVLWGLRKISLAVHVPIPEGRKEDVSLWGWPEELLSWNWTGQEGKPLSVNVYSQERKVHLYLNGKRVGEKDVDPNTRTATFEVPYKPGVLKAVNLRNGRETDSMVLKTAGKPARLRLTADRDRIRADKNDLSFVKVELLDRAGNVVPDNDARFSITCEGAGHVAASGNGAYLDMESFRSMSPKTFRGRALVVLQPDERKGRGEIRLTVSSEGIQGDSIVVETR